MRHYGLVAVVIVAVLLSEHLASAGGPYPANWPAPYDIDNWRGRGVYYRGPLGAVYMRRREGNGITQVGGQVAAGFFNVLTTLGPAAIETFGGRESEQQRGARAARSAELESTISEIEQRMPSLRSKTDSLLAAWNIKGSPAVEKTAPVPASFESGLNIAPESTEPEEADKIANQLKPKILDFTNELKKLGGIKKAMAELEGTDLKARVAKLDAMKKLSSNQVFLNAVKNSEKDVAKLQEMYSTSTTNLKTLAQEIKSLMELPLMVKNNPNPEGAKPFLELLSEIIAATFSM